MSKCLAALFLIIVALALAGIFFGLPHIAEKSVIATLSQTGFQTLTYESTQRKPGSITLKKVSFDKDHFSTASSITVTYDWAALLFHKQLREVTFDQLHLTGNTTDNATLAIAGWNQTLSLPASINTITINKASLNIMADTWGGLTFQIDGQLHHHADGGLLFQGAITGDQKQISAQANINAKLRPSGIWSADLDIGQARFDIEPYKAMRVNGKMSFKGDHGQVTKFSGLLKAGGMNYGGLPAKDVAMAIEGNLEKLGISANGTAPGTHNLAFETRLVYEHGVQAFETRVKMRSLDTLRDYLRAQNFLTKQPKTSSSDKAMLTITKIFGDRYKYQVTDDNGMTMRMGQLSMDKDHTFKDNLKPFLFELED